MKNILDIPRTAMEVFNLLPEGTLCEVIDNTLYMSPSPTTDHQRILFDLAYQLRSATKDTGLGEIFIAPCDVYLDAEQSVVQPDIIYIKKEHTDIIQRKGIYGTPDLVIEILSSNKNYDKEKKFDLYKRNGIAEYIIVDADNREVLHYLLVEGNYQLQQGLTAGRVTVIQLSLTLAF
ncbi:Uma2 family endonuclease [Mucilaginibacter sp. SMC90]|uniref:Uma2 family endonuclease n=1 Tax=Mucilaginibacter sp. SMC90 TaxID=2929803 RepID=UPI001FB3D6D6|nr:Uma2 family endonuclease [Mucilaginibacter sp. SMC90]UOE50555.1 Uma2 family endonuclease [Mucilaginibacter sp. SMC90]